MSLETVTYETLLANIQDRLVFNLPSVVVTASSVTLAVNTRYYINRPSLVMLEMPETANVGDRIEIINMSTAWQIAQQPGMNIRLYNKISSTGAAGYLASSNVGEAITLECLTASDLWFASTVIGNIIVN